MVTKLIINEKDMKNLWTVLGFVIAFNSCSNELIKYGAGDIKIFIEKGDEWLHDFHLFPSINLKNPPQIAVWIEDMNENYISSVFVSHKIATDSWSANKGNRRKEALPVWCHARGVVYHDGLYVPTKDKPITDAVTGATPCGSFDVKIRSVGDVRQFVLKVEVNHSTDWNDNYPENAKEGDSDYSDESGQPSVVYAVTIDTDSDVKQYTAALIGHGSPDGSDGHIYPDTSSLTSATKIVKQINIIIL